MSTSPRAGSVLPGLSIRPGMDVYSAAQDRYIGSVVRVWRRRVERPEGAREVEQEPAVGSVGLVHEEGQTAGHARVQGSRILGEEMGPVPTIGLGNRGPINQSAGRDYAADPGGDAPAVICFAVRPGRINLGPLTRPFYVPSSAVRSLSMERVVLELEGDAIPSGWWRRPEPD
ncbi:MAG TPA: hypothetical protein VKX16_08430 [Chloroflexota bacterium]|nr:hypothetical protein [Chloroflexota bacterium]